MGEAKPTPGEWLFEPGTDGSWWVVVLSELDMGAHKTIASRGQWLHNQAESLANGALLHDAGNTYNTTGLTPSQLVERVKELEAALSGLLEEVDLAGLGTAKDFGWPRVTSAARAALSKARPNTAEGA